MLWWTYNLSKEIISNIIKFIASFRGRLGVSNGCSKFQYDRPLGALSPTFCNLQEPIHCENMTLKITLKYIDKRKHIENHTEKMSLLFKGTAITLKKKFKSHWNFFSVTHFFCSQDFSVTTDFLCHSFIAQVALARSRRFG